MARKPQPIPTEAPGPEADASTRERLLTAAMALAETEDPSGLGLRDVARRAGVTHSAPYRHFKDRRELVLAVAERGFRDLLDHCINTQRAFPSDHLSRFWAIGVGYFTFAVERPGLFRLMFSREVARAPEVRPAEASVFALCVGAIASAQSAGLVVAGDPQHHALTAWAAMHGLAMLHLDGLVAWIGLDAPPAKLAATMAARVFAGLAAHPPGASPEA